MGNGLTRLSQYRNYLKYPHKFAVDITTGQYKGQNIANKGNVCLRLWHIDGKENQLSEVFQFSGRYFLPRSKNVLYVSSQFHQIDQIEVWVERARSEAHLNWFVEQIKCTEETSKQVTHFPVGRMITMRRQLITAVDSTLPQHDRNEQRRSESILFEKNLWFSFSKFDGGGIPTKTDVTATPEYFSKAYLYNVFLIQGVLNKVKQFILPIFTRSWKHLPDIDNIYSRRFLMFDKPKCQVDTYIDTLTNVQDGTFDQTALDKIFGMQRLTGTNPVVIRRVESTEHIETVMKRPKSAEGSLDDLLKPHMAGMTLQEAVEKELLYMIDYTDVLTDLPCKTGLIAAPIALFYVNSEEDLMPVAIQLFKKKHPYSELRDNPIFTPDNDSYTWLLAKMWFNNADASYHESVSHLGFTHLLMETVYIALHQTMSLSHPVYRLMAPHFRYVMNVNSIAWQLLVNKGGWVDTSMNIGVNGMMEIIRRKFQGDLVAPWRLNVEGNIENDIVDRGVEKLPKYTYRDDALALHKIIKKYVTTKVKETYKDNGQLRDDYELQAWGKILYDPAKPTDPEHTGCGIKGLAFEQPKDIDGQVVYFQTLDHVIDTITSIIFNCSAVHAVVNFRQYDEYGFPLNYPGLLHGDPPRNKTGTGPGSVKAHRNEQDILQALPTKQETLATMTIVQILSNKGTVDKEDKNQLGKFPVQYQFTQDGGVPENVKIFQDDLDELSKKIKARDNKLKNEGKATEAYDVLDPEFVPNSISL